MTPGPTTEDRRTLATGWDPDPARSMSLSADAYTDPRWYDVEVDAIFSTTWQWVCHVEKVREPGAYTTTTIAGRSVVVVRDDDGPLRAFSNVCMHRAHELLSGDGTVRRITCPYHAWSYGLDGGLRTAPHTDHLVDFDPLAVCLDALSVEEFGGFIYVNLDPGATPLVDLAGDLAAEIAHWAPDVSDLTHAHRLTYEIESDWKNVIDNFLECYHCPVAHRDFCTLVDMDTYEVTTHGLWSSHMAEAGRSANTAYSVDGATVTDHAVWWLWPNTCLMRYPGRGNFIVMHVVPDGPGRTRETYDFFFETAEATGAELEAITYVDDVLQAEDIALVESVQRGMATPAFTRGRIVHDPTGSGKSEHAVHHFHGLLLEAYGSLGT